MDMHETGRLGTVKVGQRMAQRGGPALCVRDFAKEVLRAIGKDSPGVFWKTGQAD
jgi:hypothetical protein